MKVIAYVPNFDGPTMRFVEAFADERTYEIDCRVGTWSDADNLLARGDTLILNSLLDLDQSDNSLKGLNTVIDLTDIRRVTIVTARENYVLKDDSTSHIQAGLCFFSRMMAQSYNAEQK